MFELGGSDLYLNMFCSVCYCNLIVDLQASTLALDFRVTVLEENGGGDGNSSIAELEARVETLEGTAADHESRISATESDVTSNSFKYMIEMNLSNKKIRNWLNPEEIIN